MTTETGNAQSEVADPSQPYGLSRWLASQPLFSETKTPTVKYERPASGLMGQIGLADQANSGLLPWLNSLPEKDASSRESRSIGADAASFDSASDTPEFARTGKGLGSILGDVGTAAGTALRTSGLGAIGTLAGTGIDQLKANQALSRHGAQSLGIGDYFGSVLGNTLPGFMSNALGIRDTNQRMLDSLDLSGYFDAWTQADLEAGMRAQGILDSLNYSAPQASPSPDGNISYTYPSDDEMNAPGATGGESANDTGGGWSGGSDDRDVESGGEW